MVTSRTCVPPSLPVDKPHHLMLHLLDPTVDLFLYDLQDSLGDDQAKRQQKRERFTQKIPEDLRSQLEADSEEYRNPQYHYLFKKHYLSLSNKESRFGGHYYPIQLTDSYGLIIQCHFKNKNTLFSPDCFQDLKTEINQQLNHQTATLGQTWVISAYLDRPANASEDITKLAKDCYRSFMPDLTWDGEFVGKGYFLGATVFELSRQRFHQDKESETILQNQHTLIIIYPNQDAFNASAKFYSHWMILLSYYHKITWSYIQSLILIKSIKNNFIKIQDNSESINEKIVQRSRLYQLRSTLKNIQKNLNQYTAKLYAIDLQKGTIDINLSNYQERLKTIEQKAKQDYNEETNLQFLEKFRDLVTRKYLKQINKSSENLEKGLKFLENSINLNRTQIEVEKAERDRLFQDLVSIAGAGLAVNSLSDNRKEQCNKVSSQVSKFLGSDEKPIPEICDSPMFYSLIIIFIVGMITWGLRKILLD